MKRAIVLCVVISLLIVGCGGGSRGKSREEPTVAPAIPEVTVGSQEPSVEAMDESGAADTVVVLVPQAVETLDPYLMTTLNPEDSVAAHVWDTLAWINDDLALEPRLAASWRLVNDTIWEFKLREDVTFHNGEPFDAEAVKFSIGRAAQLEGGGETFAADVGLRQVEVVDDYTVHLVVGEPDASVPYQLASVEMLPPAHYGSGADDVTPVGSGPYRFLRQESDGSVVLEAYADYWQGQPVLSTLVFRPVEDPAARVANLLEGEAQLISGLSPDQVEMLQTDDTRVEVIESTRRLFVGIRADDSSPLSDRRVRQALNYAIDVDALVDSLVGGYGQRYDSWVNPPHNLDTLVPWPYDTEKARELLTEAGYPDGFPVALDAPTGRYYQDQAIAYAIAKQLAEVGIEVQVQPYEWSVYVSDRLIPKETSPLFLLGLASRGDGLEDVTNLAVDFPFNPTRWYNVEFERLVAEARTMFNDSQRQTLLDQAQAIAYEEAPWIWLWRPYDFYGLVSWLDWKPRPDGLIYLYRPKVPDQ